MLNTKPVLIETEIKETDNVDSFLEDFLKPNSLSVEEDLKRFFTCDVFLEKVKTVNSMDDVKVLAAEIFPLLQGQMNENDFLNDNWSLKKRAFALIERQFYQILLKVLFQKYREPEQVVDLMILSSPEVQILRKKFNSNGNSVSFFEKERRIEELFQTREFLSLLQKTDDIKILENVIIKIFPFLEQIFSPIEQALKYKMEGLMYLEKIKTLFQAKGPNLLEGGKITQETVTGLKSVLADLIK